METSDGKLHSKFSYKITRVTSTYFIFNLTVKTNVCVPQDLLIKECRACGPNSRGVPCPPYVPNLEKWHS